MNREATQESARKGLPHSSDCFVCGENNPDGFRLRFEIDDQGHVYLPFKARSSMQGYGTVMHGGLQATLMDETMGWAASVALKRMTVAAELNVRYVQRTPLDTDLVVEAWVTRINARMSMAEAVLRDHEGNIYSKGKGKFIPLTLEETKYVDEHLIYHEGDARIFDHLMDTRVAKSPI
jgi:uncharacterized protein (TIGR00369 family)